MQGQVNAERCTIAAAEPAWKQELAGLNEAIIESRDEPELSDERIAVRADDKERVFLVGVQVKSRRKVDTAYSGAHALAPANLMLTAPACPSVLILRFHQPFMVAQPSSRAAVAAMSCAACF